MVYRDPDCVRCYVRAIPQRVSIFHPFTICVTIETMARISRERTYVFLNILLRYHSRASYCPILYNVLKSESIIETLRV